MMLDVAHLIDRKSVDRYLSRFSATSATMREYQMQLSGPWPPYHFVHRLTCGIHNQQSAAAVQLPAAMLADASRVRIAESVSALA
jgi:hypothetical protein